MERTIICDTGVTLANVPKCLKGLQYGEPLVIKKFPDCREYPDYAKYMVGIEFDADDLVRWNLQCNVGHIFNIDADVFKNSGTDSALKTMQKNGYKGDTSEIDINIYADMVEFKNEHDDTAEEVKKRDIGIKIPDEKKDPKVIEEMIARVDAERIEKMMSISIGRGKKPAKDAVNWFMHEWATNKYEFYLAFGREFSVSTDIKYRVDSTEMSGVIHSMYTTYPKYAATLDLISRSCINMSAYVDNKMPYVAFFATYFPETYTKGMNVSKFLSRLLNDPAFDIDFSKVMQDREVSGKITISIDPYDYLTSSINMHGWHSCHSLTGQWRAGCYTFAVDPSTLIVFRDNGREYTYGTCVTDENGDAQSSDFGKNSFCGNSKSWRQMMHVDKGTCAAVFSREYPSNKPVDGVCEVARNLYESVISKYLDIGNEWDNYGDIANMKLPNAFGKVIYEDVTIHHYSDIANWESLARQYKIKKTLVAPKCTDMGKVKISVGGELHCLRCGKVLNGKDPSHHIICENCN